jgi:hypothetical protein
MLIVGIFILYADFFVLITSKIDIFPLFVLF